MYMYYTIMDFLVLSYSEKIYSIAHESKVYRLASAYWRVPRFFHVFTLAGLIFIVIRLFSCRVIFALFLYLLENGSEWFAVVTLIFIEYGLTISGHVSVLSQWTSE